DPIALNIPDYPKIVKRPMDLSTIRQNLADNYYDDPQEVHSDVKLMFKNCYLFNPPGTPVAAAGKALQ
ncbi:Bromodomain-containing protein, partial [Mrakia frigida]|uniref:Bromodomain-containing protein n=1 Tax=Mrakia frigida TaxID=29902 RepID=UPI003FCBF6CE